MPTNWFKVANISGTILAPIIVPDNYPTIQAAINAASDGDTVFVRNGTYYESVVVNKQVRLLGENRIGTIIDANATDIVLKIVANNVHVSGFTVKGSGITSPDSGVLLQGVANCHIFGNNVIENLGDGIFLISCSNNVIIGNEVVGNDVDGISVSGSTFNTISNNNVTGNGWSGIGLFGYSSDNNVTSNNVVNNPEGIAVVISARNEISENTIMSNSNWGISIYQSLNNSISHNEFNNSLQVNSDGSPNTWNNGYPSGGNFWSDYNGTDTFRGMYQNETGSDGIGDSPYTIDSSNIDTYPLMNPWSLPDIAVTNLTSLKTVIGQGYSGSLNVTFENLGNKIEAFNATLYANSTCIHSEQIMLAMTNCTLSFGWNTTGFAKGNYTVFAYAEPVQGETKIADNNFTGGCVYVSMDGDLTGGSANPWNFVPDGKCDGKDITIVALCFGSAPVCQPPWIWNPNSDVNNDGKVDGKDIALVALHFGQADP